MIATYGIPEASVTVISNGFDPNYFKVLPDVTTDKVLNELGIKQREIPLITFVSKFTEFKAIDILLEAAAIYEKQLPGVQTLLIGNGELWDNLTCIAALLLHKPVCTDFPTFSQRMEKVQPGDLRKA